MTETKRIGLLTVLGWIFGILFLLSALGLLVSGDFASGIILALAAIIIIPSFGRWLKKKHKIELSRTLRIVIFVILIILSISLLSTEGAETVTEETLETLSSEEVTEANEDAEETPQEEEIVETTYEFGDEIVIDELSYTVSYVNTAFEVGQYIGDSLFGEEADGIFQIVYLTIENVGTESTYIYSDRFTIIDSEGREFDDDSLAKYYHDDAISFGEQLQPGLPVEGVIIFDLPTDAEGLTLKITGDAFSLESALVNLS